MREQHLPFRYDWEAVVTPAVDYALQRPDVDGEHLALMGMSLGGYLAARAVAFEHRFRAAVFFDGVYDLHQTIAGMLPKAALTALQAGDASTVDDVVEKAMTNQTGLRWAMTQGVWSFGTSTIAEFLTETKRYTMDGIAARIECPCLVMDAEDDMFFKGQPQQIYDALKAPKLLFTFTREDGAENHCQSGALSYKDEIVFNWLDETLQLHDDREGDRAAPYTLSGRTA